jgi:hypothetical protein
MHQLFLLLVQFQNNDIMHLKQGIKIEEKKTGKNTEKGKKTERGKENERDMMVSLMKCVLKISIFASFAMTVLTMSAAPLMKVTLTLTLTLTLPLTPNP